MKNINDIITWKQTFGLLPIHLIPTQRDENCYIMLNGGNGDFCLKTINEGRSPESYHALAWSSNTKNFVVIDEENVNIYNWKKDKTETIHKTKVEDNFGKFYKYLISNSYKSDNDIVPFVIDIFKQFRNITQERTGAVEALNLLFVLIAGIEEDLNAFDFDKWGLSKIEIPRNFEQYRDKLNRGFSNITPKLELILRHSSGVLFQEAQKEVLTFDRQLDLWGAHSNKIESQKSLYSSIHYTPPYLARTIVENALSKLTGGKQTLRLFDPACGSSEFFIEALKQLNENGYTGSVEITGWDSSETAINTSKFLLTYEKRTIWKERLTFDVKLVNDSLLEEWRNDYDIILMNPPFVSWEQLDKESREAVKGVLKLNIIGKPNQASAFFYKAVQSLNDEGIIGCIVPSSLLTLDAYQKLRSEVIDLINIDLIGKLGNFVFEDALTDVSLIIGHKTTSKSVPYVLWTKNEKGVAQDALRDLRKMHFSESHKVNEKDYSIYQPMTFPITKENWKPISLSETELFKTIERFVFEKKLVRIQDVFSVQQGIRTGNNAIFKIPLAEYNGLPETEQKYFRPVVDNEAIKNGLIRKENYIWFPYNEQGLVIRTEEQLGKLANFFYTSNLYPNKEILENRVGVSEWWGLTRPRNWQFSKVEKLISTEFGKSDSFAFDKMGEFAVERGSAWIPRKEFKDKNFFYFYLALFSNPFFDKLLSIYSKQLLSGWDLGKKHTRDIPIPNVQSLDVLNSPAFIKLVEIGKELSEGHFHLISMFEDIIIQYYYPQNQD
jgi:hypothetical protein